MNDLVLNKSNYYNRGLLPLFPITFRFGFNLFVILQKPLFLNIKIIVLRLLMKVIGLGFLLSQIRHLVQDLLRQLTRPLLQPSQ